MVGRPGEVAVDERPRFVRVVPHVELNASFKAPRATLRSEGADPATVADPLFFYDEASRSYAPLTAQTATEQVAGLPLRQPRR